MKPLLIVICVIGSIGCNNQQGPAPFMPTTTVQVWLDKPVEKIEGLTWPADAQLLAESKTVDADASITLHFPSGRKYSTSSKATFLNQKKGVVSDITVTPLTETTTFAEALAKVKTLTEDFRVQKDERISSKIHGCEIDPPKWFNMQSRTIGCEMEKGIDLFIEIKPARERERWFLSYNFSVSHFFK